jgi:hypothetical protein
MDGVADVEYPRSRAAPSGAASERIISTMTNHFPLTPELENERILNEVYFQASKGIPSFLNLGSNPSEAVHARSSVFEPRCWVDGPKDGLVGVTFLLLVDTTLSVLDLSLYLIVLMDVYRSLLARFHCPLYLASLPCAHV